MKIYTRTGDSGTTSLFGGTRVDKNDLRIETYGTIDELNSFVGLLKDSLKEKNQEITFLEDVQRILFNCGALIANEKPTEQFNTDYAVTENHVKILEEHIDEYSEKLPPLTDFILPGGHVLTSYCHVCRTICRRAERSFTACFNGIEGLESILTYINRLSDFFFVLARKLTIDNYAEEKKWKK